MSRFEMMLARMQNEAFYVEPNFAQTMLDGVQAYREGRPTDLHTEIANDSVTLQVVKGSLGVIAVDGAMYKKNIGGLCASVVSYDQLISAHREAEANTAVEKIVYRVDTPGGSVAGLEEFRDVVVNSTKPVYVYAENIFASAGMYAFTNVTGIYANESTILGSIGTIVLYQKSEKQVFAVVSSNAPNKHCDMEDGACKDKLQKRLDDYEALFLDKLELAFQSKTREQIISDFDHGGTVMAAQAFKMGYIEAVMPFQELLSTLVGDEKLSSEKTGENNIKGLSMKLEEMQASLDVATATIGDRDSEIAALTQRVGDTETALATANTAVRVGLTHGASQEVILEAMALGSEDAVKAHIFQAIATDGAVSAGESVDAETAVKAKQNADNEAILAFAAATRGGI